VFAAVLLALSALIRLVWVISVPTRPVVDFAMYVESAHHLLAFGSFDEGFAYMPGYVFILAALQGHVLGAKLVNALLFAPMLGLGVWLTTRQLFGRRVGLVALALYAVWPGGMAMTSVVGTDLPATSLICLAIGLLVTWSERRPTVAAVAFGLVMGLAAWIRAVALPLAALSALYFCARGAGWRATATRTALAIGTAVVVLLPWGVRNHQRHGEFFLTDSHGGLTALLGANPNSDGEFAFDLYRMFETVNGSPVLTGDHRSADRAAYRMALDWTWFEPRFALGLAIAKGERLFAREQQLLYWPIYRAGALPPAQRAWFDRHRRALYAIADVYWFSVVAAFVMGLAVLASRRRLVPLAAVLPAQVALAAIYVLFFAEARYRLPIEALAFPIAAFGLTCLPVAVTRPGERRALLSGGVLLLVIVVGLPPLGDRLRDRYRWTARSCHIDGVPSVCKERVTSPSVR
jgi:hypothetical protein